MNLDTIKAMLNKVGIKAINSHVNYVQQYKDWFNTDWTIGTNHAVCTVIDVNDSQCVYVIDATSSYKIYPEDGYYESIRLSN